MIPLTWEIPDKTDNTALIHIHSKVAGVADVEYRGRGHGSHMATSHTYYVLVWSLVNTTFVLGIFEFTV